MHLAVALVAALLLGASAPAARAHLDMIATLDTAQEVPEPAGAPPGAGGTAQFVAADENLTVRSMAYACAAAGVFQARGPIRYGPVQRRSTLHDGNTLRGYGRRRTGGPMWLPMVCCRRRKPLMRCPRRMSPSCSAR